MDLDRLGLTRLTRRSPSSYAILASMSACYVLLSALPGHAAGVSETLRILRLLLRSILFVLGVGMFVTADRTKFRYMLTAHFLVSVLVLVNSDPSVPRLVLLMLPNILAAGTYEAYPLNVFLGVGAVTAVSIVTLLLEPGLSDDAAVIGIMAAFGAVSLSLVTRYREQVIPLQRRVNYLEENVSALTRANSLSQDYAKDIEEESRQAERRKLTRDIHDMVGYTFTNTIMMTEAAKVMARNEPGRIEEFMETIRSAMEESLEEIKDSLRHLRNQDRPPESIDIAVRKLLRVFSLSTGVETDVEYGNMSWETLDAFADCVYHFVQEGLINAFRHGQAQRLTIFLWDYGNEYRICVADDGSGADGPVAEGIGIQGMRERASVHGGRVVVDRAAIGFRISMYLPAGE